MTNGRPARRTVPARFVPQDTDASVAAHDPPPTPAQPAESYGRMCGGLMRPSHMTPITPRTRHTTHDIPRTTRRLDFPQTAPIVDKAAARQDDAGWSSSVARWAHNPEVHGSNPCPATNVVIWPLISVPKSAAFPFTVAIWMKGDQAATVPREVGDHKRLVVFIADLQLSNPREATGVKFLNEAEAGHKSYVTIDFVPSSRSSAQKRSAVHHPADIIGIMPQRVNISSSA